MADINGIPVYRAELQDAEGMLRVSLVDAPAVMSDFLTFSNEKKLVRYAVKDEEKRLVYGVVMRADFPIYRIGNSGHEYYIIYTPEVIRQMAEKYLADNRANLVDTMHNGQDVEGVQMVQWFIKDTAKGINPKGFENVADGTLMAEYHVTNDDVWGKIKSGAFKGFSLEGEFYVEPMADQSRVNEIVENTDKFSRFMKRTSILAKLAKMLSRFGEVTTDKGILVWEGDEAPAVGDAVSIESEDGEFVTPEDGEYSVEDGTTYVVANGVITEIIVPEEPTEEEPEQEEQEEEAPEGEEEPTDDVDALRAEVERLQAENDELRAEVARLQAELAETESMRSELEALKKKPLVKSAHEEVKEQSYAKTGIRGLDNLSRLMR